MKYQVLATLCEVHYVSEQVINVWCFMHMLFSPVNLVCRRLHTIVILHGKGNARYQQYQVSIELCRELSNCAMQMTGGKDRPRTKLC